MTATSEFSYSVLLTPDTVAQPGESARAWRPTRWSSSDSPPPWSSDFDSGEPFWSSHTVSRMKSVNCRYSDCQFSITAAAYAEEVT